VHNALNAFRPAKVRLQTFHCCAVLTAIFAACLAAAGDLRPPAGNRYAGASAIPSSAGPVFVLPGGRLLKPLGVQIETGPGTSGLAVSPRGLVATADAGPERFGVSIITPPSKKTPWEVGHIWARTPHSRAAEIAPPDWRGVTAGIVFDSEKSLWITEGDSGKIRQLELASGDHGRIVNLNSGSWTGSFTSDLAYDSGRRLLIVIDQANARLVVIDQKNSRIMSSTRLGEHPFALGLAPDGLAAYVADSDRVNVVDLRDPAKPVITGTVETPSPQAVLAVGDRVYISNARDGSIQVVSATDRKIITEIPLAIPTLEAFRGILPAGMAYDPVNKWLLVAETGINAVGIVDTSNNRLIAHIPVGWMPVKVAIAGDRVYVANARGKGTGASPRRMILGLGNVSMTQRGTVSSFVMPAQTELKNLTAMVYSLNGFVSSPKEAAKPPEAIQHVVLIVNGGRTFDEVMGDVAGAGNGPVESLAKLAAFSMHGSADGGKSRFSVHDAKITPNQHEIARRWAFSDNFYAAGETKAEGEYWLGGGYPDIAAQNAIRASHSPPGSDDFWDHLRRNGVSFARVDGAKGLDIPDAIPRFLRIDLPDDRKDPDPANGYPYDASYVAQNDFAAGKILERLSHSESWRNTVVFITETDTEGGLDHVDSHRTLLFAAGPYVRRNYVSHTNSSVPGLLKTIYALLNVPPLNLQDKSAAGLWDLFTDKPDFSPFSAVEPDSRIYTPKH